MLTQIYVTIWKSWTKCLIAWWYHAMEIFSTLLALCAGKPPRAIYQLLVNCMLSGITFIINYKYNSNESHGFNYIYHHWLKILLQKNKNSVSMQYLVDLFKKHPYLCTYLLSCYIQDFAVIWQILAWHSHICNNIIVSNHDIPSRRHISGHRDHFKVEIHIELK